MELMTVKEVLKLLPMVSRQTLFRWCDDGDFPPRIMIGPRKTVFNKEDVRKWCESKGMELPA